MRRLTLCVLSSLVAACSSGGDAADPAGSLVGDALLPLPERGLQQVLTPFTLAPGEEATWCRFFKVPPGDDAFAARIETMMAPGSHHLLLYTAPGSYEDGDRRCDQLGAEHGSWQPVFATQERHAVAEYPAGIARRLPAGTQFIIENHYINLGVEPLRATATINFSYVDASSVTQEVGLVYLHNYGIRVPPASRATTTRTCVAQTPVDVLALGTHMHRRGVRFTIWSFDGTTRGEPLVENTDWENPGNRTFDPPRTLQPGEGFTFECEYENADDHVVTFGPSANDEMCLVVGAYAPGPAALECVEPGARLECPADVARPGDDAGDGLCDGYARCIDRCGGTSQTCQGCCDSTRTSACDTCLGPFRDCILAQSCLGGEEGGLINWPCAAMKCNAQSRACFGSRVPELP